MDIRAAYTVIATLAGRGLSLLPVTAGASLIPLAVKAGLVALAVASGWTYLKVRDHNTAVRVGVEYERAAIKQREAHKRELEAAARRTADEIERVDGAWKVQFQELGKRSGDLADELRQQRERNEAIEKAGKPVKCEYSPRTTKLLREKAAAANKRYLK